MRERREGGRMLRVQTWGGVWPWVRPRHTCPEIRPRTIIGPGRNYRGAAHTWATELRPCRGLRRPLPQSPPASSPHQFHIHDPPRPVSSYEHSSLQSFYICTLMTERVLKTILWRTNQSFGILLIFSTVFLVWDSSFVRITPDFRGLPTYKLV